MGKEEKTIRRNAKILTKMCDVEEVEERGRKRQKDDDKKRETSARRRGKHASSSADRHATHKKRHRHNLKVGKYDGSSDIETFLKQFGYIATYNRWDNEDCLANLIASLTGSAK